MQWSSPTSVDAALEPIRREKQVPSIQWPQTGNRAKISSSVEAWSLGPELADCRPPSKDSNFATSDHGRAWYATRKLTLVNATTEVRRSAIAAGLVMA
jgi:hypothetical protein